MKYLEELEKEKEIDYRRIIANISLILLGMIILCLLNSYTFASF